ncbi:MAG: dihydrofolate reductase family protein [Bacillus sp. (in: firmicutes)]
MKKRKVLVYIATSLDGYIAKEDGGLDWLHEAEGEGDNGYEDFIASVDTVIMGRKTYEDIHELAGEYPYQGKKSYVFTTSAADLKNTAFASHVEFIAGEAADLIAKLQAEPGSNIWLVGGANLLQEFLKDDLVDEYIISIIPAILGKGIPLFSRQTPETRLQLLSTKQYGQIAQLHYIRKE